MAGIGGKFGPDYAVGSYVWFSYCVKGAPHKQQFPWISAVGSDSAVRQVHVVIPFPGVIYQIPLPPVGPVSSMRVPRDYSGVICDEDKVYEAPKIPMVVELSNPEHEE